MSDTDGQLAIIIEYRVTAESRAAFLAQLAANCAETLADDGCWRMEVSEPVGGDGLTFWLTERWRDQAAIDRHRLKPGHDDGHKAIDLLVAAKRVVKARVLHG